MENIISHHEIFQHPEAVTIKFGLLKMIAELRNAFPWSRLACQTNGWNSPKGDWSGDWHCPALEIVKSSILKRLPDKGYEAQAWFNVLDPGGVITSHNHHKAELSAVYHIQGSGELILCGLGVVPAIEGRIAVFGGLIDHYVPGPITEQRISLAINFHRKTNG